MSFEKEYEVEKLSKIILYNQTKYLSFKEGVFFEKNEEYEKILNARYSKVGRIKRRLIYLLTFSKYIWFCTFTFDNYYIDKCTRTKRDLIKSVIDTHDFKFILNIDYGKTTEREHYHCIIGTNLDLDLNSYFQNNYPCFCLAINCKTGQADFNKLSKYINKLTNHCIKATTKRQRILYNFKGFDLWCPTYHDSTIAYILAKQKLFENDTLLDKGVIT